MILVTLGTQDKSFVRLLDAVESVIKNGNVREKVVVQAGLTKYQSDHMEIFDFLSDEQFRELLNQADTVITHGGVGTITAAIKLNKPVIAAPRLKQYGEHTNDHQVEIIRVLSRDGCLLPLWEMDDLPKLLEAAHSFTPKPFVSNTKNIIAEIRQFIDNLDRDN
ncbi:MAG: PssE/Cps14G family polysaccharide biosynthesis glycosyltransferase [Erysipelotrichaceae bacterium]|nr:PssE/Cps14G family polysaccharide biosynthesis glycosyltransferase [Erysipelotrichaceae bacterium]